MSTAQVLVTLLFALIWLVALAGHLVLLKLLLTPAERAKLRLPAKSWLFLLSITIADLAALLLGLPFTALFDIFDEWLFGALLCRLAPFVKTASVTMSAYGILALLVQSYEIACKPPPAAAAASRPVTSSTKLNVLVALNALFALVTSLPLLIAPTVKLYKGPVHEDLAMLMFEEAMIGERRQNSNETLLVERAVCYVPREFDGLYAYCHFQELYLQLTVPLGMVIFLFIKTADAVSGRQAVEAKKELEHRNEQQVEAAGEQLTQQVQTTLKIPKSSVKFVKMSLALAVAFHLLRSPATCLKYFISFSYEPALTLWYACTILAESTYFIKPFLLLAANDNFRNALRTIGAPDTTDHEDTESSHQQVHFSALQNKPVTP